MLDCITSCESDPTTSYMSPKMMRLWQRAIDSGVASVLDDLNMDPDELLSKVEEFDSSSQAIEHSYPAMIYPSGDSSSTARTLLEDDTEDDEDFSEDDSFDEDDPFDAVESEVPLGSLPIDMLAMKLSDGEDEN